MEHSIADTLYKLLRELKIEVSHNYIRQKVTSHPNYPTLLSITETLEDLEIEHAALRVTKDKVAELTAPFLIHTSENKGSFVFVKDKTRFVKKNPQAFNKWEGVVLVAQKASIPVSAENDEMLRSEKKKIRNTITLTLSVFFVSLLALLNNFSVTNLLLFAAAISGILTALLIIQQEMGITNTFTEQLCGINKQTDCNAVLNSKASKLPYNLFWSDIGLVHFSSMWLILTLNFITGQTAFAKPAIAIICISAIPFTIFSVYYQWRIVKKWCMLCLATVTTIWIHLLLLLPALFSFKLTKEFGYASAIIVAIYFITTSMWLLVLKPLLYQLKEAKEDLIPLMRFKRSPEIIAGLIKHQRSADTSPLSYDLQLGNKDAPIQLQVACNPYCSPCAMAHKTLHDIIEQNKNTLGLSIRFAIASKNKSDKNTKAVQYILQHLITSNYTSKQQQSDYHREVLHQWYESMNFESFKIKFPLSKTVNVDEILRQHEEWTTTNKLEFTPTAFINGHELPKPYTIYDLPMILDILKRENPGTSPETEET
jgi:protein-disulfide isomerase/uncharacterized membrane protein